jgi:spore maturation protein CgeB
MRLMIVGSDRQDAIENYFVKYLRQQDIDILFFPAHSWFYKYYYSSIWNKLVFRAGLSGIYPKINREFRRQVETFRPTIIWVFKGMEIYPASLEWARTKGITLVNYNPDNPFVFTGKGSGNRNVTRSIGLFDLHFTYNLDIQHRLEHQLHARTALLPFGFDIAPALYETCAQQEEMGKTCFLGNPDKHRALFIKKLAEEGVSIDVYGGQWDKWLRHPNIRIFGPVYGDEMWKVLRKYRIQLNLMRIHNENSHNMRTFEVPAIGGIMLAPDTKEHRMFFEEGKEIFLFSGVKDCAAHIHELLALSPGVAEGIRSQARRRSLTAGYSYEERTAQALEQILTIV